MAEKGLSGWVEVLPQGTHTDSKGRVVEFSTEGLDGIVESTKASPHAVPGVVGHPKANTPAFCWMEDVKRDGKSIFVKFKNIYGPFEQAVKDQLFPKRSISLRPDSSIRHIGFLGAVAPAIPGMRDVAFAEFSEDEGCQVFTFTAEAKSFTEAQNIIEKGMAMTEEELKAKLTEAEAKGKKEGKEEAHVEFSEAQAVAKHKDLVAARKEKLKAFGATVSKCFPGMQGRLTEFAEVLLEGEETYEFSEPDGKGKINKAPFEAFVGLFEGLPDNPMFKVMEFKEGEETVEGSVFASDIIGKI